MKTKENFEIKLPLAERPVPAAKQLKSLRPMRSLMKTRSFKPKTVAAGMIVKSEEVESRA